MTPTTRDRSGARFEAVRDELVEALELGRVGPRRIVTTSPCALRNLAQVAAADGLEVRDLVGLVEDLAA
jgi:hypothetical protein